MFTEGQKVRKLAPFKTSFNFKPHAFEKAAGYLKSKTNFLCRKSCPMLPPRLVKLDIRTPENGSVKVRHPLKLYGENVLNRQ